MIDGRRESAFSIAGFWVTTIGRIWVTAEEILASADDEKAMLRCGVSTTPSFALIDKKGIVRLYPSGRLAESAIEQSIDSLLKRK